jgi:hypothetical protein
LQPLAQWHAAGRAAIGALQPHVQPWPGQLTQEHRASVFMEILS